LGVSLNARTRREIKQFYWLNGIQSFGYGFAMAVYVVFLQRCNLSFSEIAIVTSISAVGLFLFELPTGILADWRGQKFMLVTSGICAVIGFFLYSVFESFLEFCGCGGVHRLVSCAVFELARCAFDQQHPNENWQESPLARFDFF
jgi:MFS family permease